MLLSLCNLIFGFSYSAKTTSLRESLTQDECVERDARLYGPMLSQIGSRLIPRMLQRTKVVNKHRRASNVECFTAANKTHSIKQRSIKHNKPQAIEQRCN